jgi:hypothetical protein
MSKKKELDWKEFGRFFGVIVSLFTIIRDAFSGLYIGLEILGWITGEGKGVFVDEFLKPLGERFLATRRIIVIDENTIRVNLSASIISPFKKTIYTSETQEGYGSGWVTVQKRANGLYVDGSKIILHLSDHQKNGQSIGGCDLWDELKGLPILHTNILDALLEYPHLIPDALKPDEEVYAMSIIFWVARFKPLDDDFFVRCLYWNGNEWFDHYRVLCDQFGDGDFAAILEI